MCNIINALNKKKKNIEFSGEKSTQIIVMVSQVTLLSFNKLFSLIRLYPLSRRTLIFVVVLH